MFHWTRKEPAEDNLRTRVAELESQITRLRAEWADVLDRFLRMDERQRKRAERAETPEPPLSIPVSPNAALRARLAAGRAHLVKDGRSA